MARSGKIATPEPPAHEVAGDGPDDAAPQSPGGLSEDSHDGRADHPGEQAAQFLFHSLELQERVLDPLAECPAEQQAEENAEGRACRAEVLPQRGREHRGADEVAHDAGEPGRRPDLLHASLAARSSAPSPSISTVLRRDVSPPTIVTARRPMPNVSARKRTSSSFAAPSTGGARRRTLIAPPRRPAAARSLPPAPPGAPAHPRARW